jgi:Plasmid pRiA4b ORF-3-like protein
VWEGYRRGGEGRDDGAMPEPLTITEPVVYQLRVVLRGVSPLIWRRLLVRSDSTIVDLHATLQVALGWSDEHLNRFVIHGREYGVSHLGGIAFRDDPRQVRLADLGLRVRERFLYEYGFTDGWQHDVRIEQILPLVPGQRYPACIGGRRRVLPEDCGGPRAFLELRQRYSLLDIADRLYDLAERRLAMGGEAFVHDHYKDVLRLLHWLEIDRFDRRAVNRRLAELAVVPVGRAA